MPITNGPQFEMHIDMDGDSINIVAGDEDVYYNSYCEERNGVMVFIGEFTFDNGDKKLKFELFDHSNPYNLNQGIALMNDNSAFADYSSAFTGYLFFDSSAVNGQGITNMEWTIDGMVHNDNYHLVNTPGIYDVILNFDFASGASSTLHNKVYLGFENPNWGYFDAVDIGYGEYQFTSQVQNSGSVIEWVIDDTLSFVQNDLLISLDTGIHKVIMKVTDALGHEYSREKNIGFASTDFVSEFGFLKQNSSDLHNSIVITYEKKDGSGNSVVYTTKLLNQNNSTVSTGNEEHILETSEDLVLKYPVQMQFDMINENDFNDFIPSISLEGNIGFLVNK
jgi:hypothetical protein